MIFEKFYNYKIFNGTLAYLSKRIESSSKLKKNNPIIINFLNPHSYIISLKDYFFHKSLLNANFNLIDGIGIYLYFKFFKKLNCVNRITGYDLFESLIKKDLKFFFLGGNKNTSQLIKEKLLKKNVRVETYSPSFSSNFSNYEDKNLIKRINKFKPDILFVGMTAPKQEKWSYKNRYKLHCNYIINIGAVFDYYVNNYYRAPKYFRTVGLEWFYRLVQKPSLWRRTFISGLLYLYYICFFKKQNSIFFNVIDSQKKINEIVNKKKSFLLSAFNLAFFSNIYDNKLKLTKRSFLWSDGLFCKFFNSKINKIPGHKLIKDIKISNKFKFIHIIGNIDTKVNFFLKKKFNKKIIIFSPLPFGSDKQLAMKIPEVKKNSLVLLTLPTPKQEIISSEILKKYPLSKIICIGGGLKIASGSEKKCPTFLYNLGLEFIWRLQTDSKRRVQRLSKDLFNFCKSVVNADIFAYSLENER